MARIKRDERLATNAAKMSRKALSGLGTRALENIAALGNLEVYGSRAGQGRRATEDVKALLAERKKKSNK